MLMLHQLTAFLACSDSDFEHLQTDVFDQVNNTFARTFKNIKNAVWGTYMALLGNEGAQTIGLTDEDVTNLPSQERDELISKRCQAFTALVSNPGKHSVFIYDISNDKFYFKSIVIE